MVKQAIPTEAEKILQFLQGLVEKAHFFLLPVEDLLLRQLPHTDGKLVLTMALEFSLDWESESPGSSSRRPFQGYVLRLLSRSVVSNPCHSMDCSLPGSSGPGLYCFNFQNS